MVALSLLDHPLYNPIRVCEACPWREHHQCIAPVPGVGPSQAKVILVGEAPGEHEDSQGVPFTGQAGKLLDHLLQQIGLDRSQCFITNTVKCRPSRNADPPQSQVTECAPRWLDAEIAMVSPDIIVALGRFSARYLLNDTDFTMERDHGIPRTRMLAGRLRVVLPVYHPAAGLHQPNLLRWVYEDFGVLERLAKGQQIEKVIDQHPQPKYQEVTDAGLARDILSQRRFALDTETVAGPDGRPCLWSVQVSSEPGTGWFIPAGIVGVLRESGQALIPPTSTVYVHNYLYDAQFIDIPNPMDTMLMAYILQYPLGLKVLAYRLAGMDMKDYEEYVLPHRRDKAVGYLRMAQGFLDVLPLDVKARFKPQVYQEEEWDSESCQMRVKSRKAVSLQRKIKSWLQKAEADPECDPYRGWQGIEPAEKQELERLIGPMQDASLADVPVDEAVWYSCRDADATWRIALILEAQVKEMGLEQVLHDLDLPMLPVALEMMRNGMAVDKEKLDALSTRCLEEMSSHAKKVVEVLGPVNPNSPVAVKKALEVKLGRKVKSTDERDLAKLKKEVPVVGNIQGFRQAMKVRGSYAEKLKPYIDSSGRVHPRIRVAGGTGTGRLIVTDPPLQTIPVRTEIGKLVRGAFVATPGHLLLSVDESQIEMRCLAHLAKAKSLIDLFRSGGDIHTAKAMEIFGVSREQVLANPTKYRYPTKSVNFGVVYGLSPQGLSDQLAEEGVEGWGLEECKKFIEEYFKATPELKPWMRGMVAEAEHYGYVREPLFGRIRYVPEVKLPFKHMKEAGVRQAVNLPVTAAAQGTIKLATRDIWEWRRKMELPFDFLLQVHDELIFEVSDGLVRLVGPSIKGIIENVGGKIGLSVPIIAEAKTGKSWGEMKAL